MKQIIEFFTRPAPVTYSFEPELSAIAERNKQRVEDAKAKMGTAFVFHPVHKITRKKK